MILLYTQPANFTPPADLSTPNVGVSVFSLSSYVNSTGLQGPIAGMYFTVEEGTATVSVASTSAVVTSTLPVPSSTGATTTGSGSNANQSHSAAMKIGDVKNSVVALFAAGLTAFAFA